MEPLGARWERTERRQRGRDVDTAPTKLPLHLVTTPEWPPADPLRNVTPITPRGVNCESCAIIKVSGSLISLIILLFHKFGQSQHIYQFKIDNRSQNAVLHPGAFHWGDLAGTPSGRIFCLISLVPTVAHLFGRWRDPAQGHSSTLFNYYHRPLCFLGDLPRPRSEKNITHFSGRHYCDSRVFRAHQCKY